MRSFVLVAAVWLAAAPGAAAAETRDCSALPTEAQRPRTCNPQAECFAQIQQRFQGQALQDTRKNCLRMPTSGTCYGPETYNPQAECLDKQKK